MEKYDLIIIGAGPGGYESAVYAAENFGMKVAVIEKQRLGGTCLNRGCIPTKAMLHSALLYNRIRRHGDELGLTGSSHLGYDLSKIQKHKNAVVDRLKSGINFLMKTNSVVIYKGHGAIMSEKLVSVTDDRGGVEVLETSNILIATGSITALPPIPGIDNHGVVTSETLLELDKSIKTLTIIGGGVIGCEFASLFSSLGTKVTIIEAMGQLLPNMDRETAQNLKMILKRTGDVDVHTNSTVTRIEKNDTDGGTLKCLFNEKNSETESGIESDMILISVGRAPYTSGLVAEDAPKEITAVISGKGDIEVNENFETHVPGIYAIGDVTGGAQLAHVAAAEGKIAVSRMNGADPEISMDIVPSCIYTEPEIASVGLTPMQAKDMGIDAVSHKYTMNANGKSLLSLQERGFIRLTVAKDTGKILGAQMMCARATDMISQFSQAIVSGITPREMARTVYPHPTFSEGIPGVLAEFNSRK